ncbi:MAG: hypothetical protein LC781_18830, partial [Actinobacteria bacterium]|nr:hypothetical protein [Actinomycetota bacterium]
DTGNTNGVEGCENPEVVETFTGSNSQITPSFEITGNTFRLSLEADLVQEGEFGFVSIDSVDEEGLVVPFGGIFVNPVEGPTDESANVLEGPGTFTLRIESENVQYTVTVEDCVDENNSTAEPSTPAQNPSNQNARPRRNDVIRNTIPRRRLPPTGGLSTYVMVTGSILVGAGLLGLGLVVRRGSRD